MSVPFENQTAGQDALDGFYDAVRELRKQYRIAEVLLIFSVYCKTDDENQDQFLCRISQFGDPVKAFWMWKESQDEVARLAAEAAASRQGLAKKSD